MQRLIQISKAHNLTLLEDTCESQGAHVNGVKLGNFGLAGTFSFYWGHHMTAIEGGMLTTNSEALFKLLVLKRSHGLARELPPEYHPELKAKYPDIDFNFLFLTDGMNFRSTELNAILGINQLRRLNDFIRIRNRNYARFLAICKQYPNELIALDSPGLSSFVLPFLFKQQAQKLAFQQLIREAGIESRPLIGGNLLRQPFLRHHYNEQDYPNADFLHTNAFYIGNNQFVGEERLHVLEGVMHKFFKSQ